MYDPVCQINSKTKQSLSLVSTDRPTNRRLALESMMRKLLASLEPVLFSLIEQVRLGGAQVDNFGTPLAVLAELHALPTVVGVGDPGVAADDAASRQTAVVALVADVYQPFRDSPCWNKPRTSRRLCRWMDEAIGREKKKKTGQQLAPVPFVAPD